MEDMANILPSDSSTERGLQQPVFPCRPRSSGEMAGVQPGLTRLLTLTGGGRELSNKRGWLSQLLKELA